MTQDIALYIHVPFCRRRCRYCSFVSYAHRQTDIPAYVNALKCELEQRANREQVGSIYFGGGTPSLLPAEILGDLLAAIRSLFDLDEAAEITIEANPGTVDRTYLADIKKAGVNRLSLGIQSLNDRELEMLGRIHTAAEAIDSVKAARNAGFDNLNLDLIYGLPGQTMKEWQMALSGALALKPEHLSLYALSLEEGTPLYRMIEDKQLPAIDPDITADQYELSENLLTQHGYRHYEISNWALPGRECHHNLVYWHNQPYLGIGVAAHSHIGNHRFANTSNLDKYLTGTLLPEMDEAISPDLELAETAILGLRLDEGIGVDTRYQEQVEELTAAGLLERAGRRVKLTGRGRLLGNEVFWRFLPE
ncbi:MAG: radical SAM family heme chaperone HemW [Dehalococcoidia bacterium]|nr:MAG: radical SAM family heme chaperone HemW [Dehalococcoidia bacterium]